MIKREDYEKFYKDVEGYFYNTKEIARKLYKDGKLLESFSKYSEAIEILRRFSLAWRDDEIEMQLVNIFESLKKTLELPKVSFKNFHSVDGNKPRILVLMSVFYDYGGHSVHMSRWIKILRNIANIEILITSMYKFKSQRLDYLKKELPVVEIPYEMDPFTKAIVIHEYIKNRKFDIIFSAANSNDISAFLGVWSSKDFANRIVYFFHDNLSLFWLGHLFTREIIVDIPNFVKLIKKYDGDFKIYRIPIVPEPADQKLAFDCDDLRSKYNIPKNASIGVTVSSFHKLIPIFDVDFFKSLDNLLSEIKDIHFILIINGLSSSTWRLFLYPKLERVISNHPGRIILSNPTPNLSKFYKCSNILLAPFPISSPGVMIDAFPYGVPIVAYEDPSLPVLPSTQFCEKGIVHMKNPHDIVSKVKEAISDSEILSQRLYECYKERSHKRVLRIFENFIKNPSDIMENVKEPDIAFDKLKLFAIKWNIYSFNFLSRFGNFERRILSHLARTLEGVLE